MSRFLITTADERSWKLDRPVLFLGEWCRLYNRKPLWESMDAIVAEPFGLQAGQKKRDTLYILALSSQLLIELSDMLNNFHNTNHSLRYWNILLGRWLQRYVIIIFNRYFTVEQALNKYEVTGTLAFDHSGYSLATTDSGLLAAAERDDIWNHVLYSKILSHLRGNNADIDFEPLRGISGFSQEGASKAVGGQRLIKRFIRIAASKILPKLSRSSDALIVSSYLPRMEEIKLQISLGQFPQLWQTPQLHIVPPDHLLRQNISIDATHHTGFEHFVRKQLSEMIPSCFLEGYQQLIEQTKSLPWPDKPKFIFTSNNFDTDELFKVWTGIKVEEGRPYYVGQHGNHYGTRVDAQDWPEVVTCDKFLSWGWTDSSPKIIPAFVFKLAGQKPINPDPNGGLLLIERAPPIRLEPDDGYYQFGVHQENQFRFVEALHENIHQDLTVRLHGIFRRMCWSDDLRWMDRSPSTRVEKGASKLNEMISQSRLIVHSYDSTGILETLALNIPTLAFWHNNLDHLLDSAKPYYQLLINAGIVHLTPESAAAKVNEVWDDVDGWWMQDAVQDARKKFCNRYARLSQSPVADLKKLLQD